MKLQVEQLGKVGITVDEQYYNISKSYDRLVIVQNEDDGICYISRKRVPAGQGQINNREYWIPLGKPNNIVSLAQFKALSSVNLLPDTFEEYDGPYLIGEDAYFWVGTDGNYENNPKYQKITIKGNTGSPGKSAYQIWLENGGDSNIDEATWLDTYVKGKEGEPGSKGDPFTWDMLTDAQKAELKGEPGEDGHTPYIGSNGNWWINGKDTGKPSRGESGESGSGGTAIIETDTQIIMLVDDELVDGPILYLYQNSTYTNGNDENEDPWSEDISDRILYSGTESYFKLVVENVTELFIRLTFNNWDLNLTIYEDNEYKGSVQVDGDSTLLGSTIIKNLDSSSTYTIYGHLYKSNENDSSTVSPTLTIDPDPSGEFEGSAIIFDIYNVN